MALKKFKPTTPGQRNKIISAFDDITASNLKRAWWLDT
jgi:ribosomal protein L2